MEEPTRTKSLSDILRSSSNDKLANARQRIFEIDEILLEMPFTDPKFQELVSEQNALSVTVATKTGQRMRQSLIPSY